MFVDSVIITVQAGNGGDGCVAFRREKFDPKGGPYGGDGGKGGDVLLVADEGLNTLYEFRGDPLWAAQHGEAGRGKQQTGADGKDRILRLPPGTLAFDHETGEVLHDLRPGESVIIARGGRGGRGNERFKTSTNQSPRTAEPGTPGQRISLRLDLKLIADIGFVGLPNAGKSTLLAALTRAQPKIGAYPFTTLSPQLGIAEIGPGRRLVLADIPGLIEGAARGAGLGHEFLRHVERTRVLVHLLDSCPPDGADPAANYGVVRKEILEYSPALAEKHELVVLNKIDLIPEEKDRDKAMKKLCAALDLRPGRDALAISGAAAINLRPFLERLWSMVHPTEAAAPGWKPDSAAVEG